MATDKGLKISFCTTCKGADYLERLKQTLPQNLKRNLVPGNEGKVEFVVVAYGDPNVTQWLRETFPEEIKAGIIRAVDLPKEQAEYFKMAHAKNVAHRMSTGDVLCNLDCDNITGENFAGWLREQFTRDPNIVASVTTTNKFVSYLKGNPISDITGRVAISRENFERLHGYNEAHNAAKDGDDTNLKERAFASGLKSVSIPASLRGHVLSHTDESRHAHMSPADSAKSKNNFSSRGNLWERRKTVQRVIFGEHTVLPPDLQGAQPKGDYGCCDVTMLDENLQPQGVSLTPAPHAKWQASFLGMRPSVNTR